MKEATGELNITVITVVAIAAIAAFFYAFIWPAIKNNLKQQTYCASSYNCDYAEDGTGTNCCYKDEKDVEHCDLTCKNKQV